MYYFCTLFDSNYLDKGIVTIQSLFKVSNHITVYVLAMDNKCYDILIDLNITNLEIIKLSDFESEELIKAKANRSHAEYCWTCTASLIWYIFKKYNVSNCTYIDADMYFYVDPTKYLEELISQDKTVLIVEHGFKKDWRKKYLEKNSGKFCVQFNTFMNTPEALSVLNEWRLNTLEKCSSTEKGTLGDQMYLDEWPNKYSCVRVVEAKCLGVAPWNINRFKLVNYTDKVIHVKENGDNSTFPIVFYHFHYIKFLDYNRVNINVFCRFWKVDNKLVEVLYFDYLNNIMKVKKFLREKYNLDVILREHPAIQKKKWNLKSYVINLFGRNLALNFYYLESKIRNKVNSKKDILTYKNLI